MQQNLSWTTRRHALRQRGNQPYALAAGTIQGQLPEDGVALPGQHFQPYFQSNALALPGAYPPAVFYQLPQNLQHHLYHPIPYANPSLYSHHGQHQYAGIYSQSPGGQLGPLDTFMPSQPWQSSIQQPISPYSQQPPSQYYYPHGSYGQTGSLVPYSVPVGHLAQPYQPVSTTFGAVMTQPQLVERSFNRPMPSSGAYQAPELRLSLPEQLASATAIPRGPPIKPKRSSYALWVGNVPPHALVWDLKDHFSNGAMKDIESLFLISKSNCAFVNYSTEAACISALERFNNSAFQGYRLVCRYRRDSTSVSATPVGSSSVASRVPSLLSPKKSPVSDASNVVNRDRIEIDEIPAEEDPIDAPGTAERFFIMKSLTVQDLEQCVRHGVWVTQAHNKQPLNKAYESAVDVYLIFSVNKSGEFFGYARMASAISDHAQTIPEKADSSESLTYVYTPATEFAPKGRITNDSARGTIFWEATPLDNEEEQIYEAGEGDKGEGDKGEGDKDEGDKGEGGSQMRGNTFMVEWISTTRLSFYRTRGLRNLWNSNREVKVARDGTELEPGVGKRLVQLFHEFGPPPSSFAGHMPPPTPILPHLRS